MHLFTFDDAPSLLIGSIVLIAFIVVHELGHIGVGRHFHLAGKVGFSPWLFADFDPDPEQIVPPQHRAIIALAGPGAAIAFCALALGLGAALSGGAHLRWLAAIALGVGGMEVVNIFVGFAWIYGSDGWHIRHAFAGVCWDGKRAGMDAKAAERANLLITLPLGIVLGFAAFCWAA
jgi:hypothetical protein